MTPWLWAKRSMQVFFDDTHEHLGGVVDGKAAFLRDLFFSTVKHTLILM